MYEGDIKLLSFDGGGGRGSSSVATAEKLLKTVSNVSNGDDAAWSSVTGLRLVFARARRAHRGGVTTTSTRGAIAARLADMQELIDAKKEFSGMPSRLKNPFLPNVFQDQLHISMQQGIGGQALEKVGDRVEVCPKNGLQTIRQVFKTVDHSYLAISHKWTVQQGQKICLFRRFANG